MNLLAGEKIFKNGIHKLEEKTHVKIRHAVLLIETNEGDYQFCLKDYQAPNVMLIMRTLNRITSQLVRYQKTSGGIIQCDQCFGFGEVQSDGLLVTCRKCNGGGQVVFIKEKNNEHVTDSADEE